MIVSVAILVALVILQAVSQLLIPGLPPWLEISASLLLVIVAASVGLWIDHRKYSIQSASATSNKALGSSEDTPTKLTHTPYMRDNQQLEAELFTLNQDLLSRYQEQTNELARLNVELQLQMAMYKKAEETAHENEERFRNMADNIQEGLTILENGRLIYVNDRACEIFGDCPDGDIFGRIRAFAVPEEQARLEQAILDATNNTGFPYELEYWIRHTDGNRRFIRERYSSSITEEVKRTFIVSSDITEQLQAYQSLENAVSDRTRELSTVLDISRRIASTLELEPLLHLILDQIQTVIPFSGAAIFTLEDDQLRVAAFQIPRLSFHNQPLQISLGQAALYQQVITNQQVQIIDDVLGETPLLRAINEISANPQYPPYEHARAWIGIPLIVRDQVMGLLALTNSEPGYYTQKHARVAMTIANQVAVAIENARLYETSQNLAVLEERHRIARELHDSATQLLYGISLYCSAASRSLRGGNLSQVEQNLAEIKENALQALQEMRLLILELNPPKLQKEGLVAALRASLESIETRTGLETELKTDGIQRLPRSVEAQLYRIAMEALNNLVRYAQAKKVTVELRSGDDWIWLEIRDNGVGFDVAKARNHGGMGLHSMEQRARQLKGRMEVISQPGGGTRILVEAPVFGIVAEPPAS